MSVISKFKKMPLSRKIEAIKIKLCKLKMKFWGTHFYKSVGVGSFILDPLFISYEFIRLGNHVSFRHHARIEAIHEFAGKKFEPEIIIGDYTTFQQRCHITAAGTLTIGKGIIASFDVMITDIDHEYKDPTTPVALQPLMVKKTSIGNNCFLGGGTKIQAGTRLGNHCIVGTNAVVRGKFPDYSVIVGAPAKIIKRYDPVSKLWKKTDKNGEFID